MFKTAVDLYDWGWCRSILFSQIQDMANEFGVDAVEETEYHTYWIKKEEEMEIYFQSLHYDGNEFEKVKGYFDE